MINELTTESSLQADIRTSTFMLGVYVGKTTHFRCPVRRFRRKKQRAAAMTASVAIPRPSDKLPTTFMSAIFERLVSRKLGSSKTVNRFTEG